MVETQAQEGMRAAVSMLMNFVLFRDLGVSLEIHVTENNKENIDSRQALMVSLFTFAYLLGGPQ